MKKRNQTIKNSCGGKGCYISLYVLPYGSVRRRRKRNTATKNTKKAIA